MLTNSSKSLCKAIANALFEFMIRNKVNQAKSNYKTVFTSRFSIEDKHNYKLFFIDLATKLETEYSTILNAIILIDRYAMKADHMIYFENIAMITITAMSLSLKYNEDIILSNENIAKFCNIDKALLAKLEIQFLQTINYKLYIKAHKYLAYLQAFNYKYINTTY